MTPEITSETTGGHSGTLGGDTRKAFPDPGHCDFLSLPRTCRFPREELGARQPSPSLALLSCPQECHSAMCTVRASREFSCHQPGALMTHLPPPLWVQHPLRGRRHPSLCSLLSPKTTHWRGVQPPARVMDNSPLSPGPFRECQQQLQVQGWARVGAGITAWAPAREEFSG